MYVNTFLLKTTLLYDVKQLQLYYSKANDRWEKSWEVKRFHWENCGNGMGWDRIKVYTFCEREIVDNLHPRLLMATFL